jgi:hypothetical protein
MSEEVHEFFKLKFRPEVGYAEQVAAMEALGERLAECEGMVRRDYYFSDRDGQWVSHLVWTDEDSLEASAMVPDEADSSPLWADIHADGMAYARYRFVGSHHGSAADPA